MTRTWTIALAAVMATAWLGSPSAWAQQSAPPASDDKPAAQKVVLDVEQSYWRVRTVRQTEEVALPDGRVGPFRFDVDNSYYYKNPDHVSVQEYKIKEIESIRLPEKTAADWMSPDFDDGDWIRTRGTLFGSTKDRQWKLILMRGQFDVADPATAGELALTVRYRGGAVVYLNGQELTRANMPAGPVDPLTCAERYPKEAYLNPDGYVMPARSGAPAEAERIKKRDREITRFVIPRDKIKKGVNVLAVSIHRAPTETCYWLGRTFRSNTVNPPHEVSAWSHLALLDLRLTAPPTSSVTANVGWPTGKGFRAWNLSVVRKVYASDYPDPFAQAKTVQLSGVRNGTFAGQVVVGHDEPIVALKAVASDLKGPGVIPASAITLRYARPDGVAAEGNRARAFDTLDSQPPARVEPFATGGALQPIWLDVAVPADAKPGLYQGELTISAEGQGPLAVPIRVSVADWTLPDPKDFVSRMDIIQSPESLAMAYNVELWSDAHFKLLDQTFSLLAPLSARTLYVTAVCRTHFGNEQAMVRWVRDDEGELTPDFTIAERYIDTAVKRLGKVPGVILYCWEPAESMGHAGGAGSAARVHDKDILLTMYDPDTGKVRTQNGPAWGTAESKELWTKLGKGFREVLKKRGMEDSMRFGLVGDARPTKQAMADISSGWPECGWAIHSHYFCSNWQGHELTMMVALWGIGCRTVDPAQGLGFGWRNPNWLNYYPREMSIGSTLVEYRIKLEMWMSARTVSKTAYSKSDGARGLGRLGADFWAVLPDKRGRLSTLAGRYPESYWGQLNLNYGVPHLLGRGNDSPVPTVRSEALRENIQEIEAKVFIEKALLDEALRAKVGDDLAARCRAALDERIRMCLSADGEGLAWFVSSDWAKRTEQLFNLAAEVDAKLRQ